MLIFIPFFEFSNNTFDTLGVIKKQALQSSVLLYVGTIIGFITTGLLAPNILTKSEIGTLKLLLSWSSIFMGFSILGFSTTTIRFMPQFFDQKTGRYNGFMGLSILIGTIGFMVVLVLIFVIKPIIVENNLDKSAQFAHYFFLIIPLTIFQVYYVLFDSYNNALSRSSFGVFLRDFVQRILLLIGLLLVFLNIFDFDGYVYYYVTALCLPTILIFLHLVWHKALDLRVNSKILKKPLITSMVSVSFFGLLNNFSNMAVFQIDSIMVNAFMDSTAVGVYVITFYFGTLVFIPAKALNKIAPTLISQAFKENKPETIKEIYYKSSANLYLIGSLIFLGLMVNLDNVFNIIPRSYEDGKYVIVLIGLVNLIKMAGGTNDSIIIYSKYYKISTILLILLGSLIVGLNIIFIPIFGMTGAAFASLLSMLVYNLIKMIFIKIKFNLNPYNFQYVIVAIIATLIYIVVYYIPKPSNFIIEIGVDSLATMLLFYLAIRSLPIASEVNTSIKQAYQKALKVFYKN